MFPAAAYQVLPSLVNLLMYDAERPPGETQFVPSVEVNTTPKMRPAMNRVPSNHTAWMSCCGWKLCGVHVTPAYEVCSVPSPPATNTPLPYAMPASEG